MAEQAASPNSNAIELSQARSAVILNLIAGIWLFISAFFLALNLGMTWDNICVGVLVVILAVIRLSQPVKTRVLSWISAACGLWVVISPWVLVSTYISAWNAVITGLVILVLGVWAALVSTPSPAPAAEAP